MAEMFDAVCCDCTVRRWVPGGLFTGIAGPM